MLALHVSAVTCPGFGWRPCMLRTCNVHAYATECVETMVMAHVLFSFFFFYETDTYICFPGVRDCDGCVACSAVIRCKRAILYYAACCISVTLTVVPFARLCAALETTPQLSRTGPIASCKIPPMWRVRKVLNTERCLLSAPCCVKAGNDNTA